MRAFSWRRDPAGGGRPCPTAGRRPGPRSRLRFEVLEDRSVPAGGVLDPAFGTGGVVSSSLGATTRAYSVATYPQEGTANDGKIVVGGAYIGTNTKYQFGVVRYNLDGSLDKSFGGSGEVTTPGSGAFGAIGLAIQPDGKVVAAGDSNGDFAVVRYNVDGSLDKTFGNRGVAKTAIVSGNFDRIYAIALQPDGKIVAVGGTSPSNNSGREVVLARYNANGTLDTSFGKGGLALDHIPTTPLAGGDTDRMGIAVDPGTGQIVVEAGGLAIPNLIYHPARVIRYSGGGALDKSLGGIGYVTFDGTGLPPLSSQADVAIQPQDHRILVAGWVPNTGLEQGLARLNPDGTLDGSLTVTADTEHGEVETIKLQSDGRILVGGDGVAGDILSVLRYNPDLSPDTSFGNGGVARVSSLTTEDYAGMALEPDGRIVVVGSPHLGYWRVDVARFLATGPQIGSFTADASPVTAGSTATLIVSNITDGNPNGTVTQVAFYYFDSGGVKQLLGYGDQTSPGVWSFTFTVNLPPGSYTLFAQGVDTFGALGDPVSLVLTVQ
jgi:uncharacterized delta-60 repeat protein